MHADAPFLEAHGVSRRFGSTQVLQEVDVRLGPGERLGLTGPNGSGKTTLLRCIAGSLTPSEGTITVEGHPAGSMAARTRTGIAVANEKAFYQRLTGRHNLELYAAFRAPTGSSRSSVESLVDELELDFVDHRVDRYSSGMLQQLSFARALLGAPKLLLLDEPTRSLDEAAFERLWSALVRRPELTAVVATHSPADLERCDRQLVLT